jgi:hypothetical protein
MRARVVSVGRWSSACRWACLAGVALAVLLAPQTQAVGLSSGGFRLNLDTTLSWEVACRLEDRDQRPIDFSNGGTAYSVKGDDGNSGFDKGIYSNTFELTPAIARAPEGVSLDQLAESVAVSVQDFGATSEHHRMRRRLGRATLPSDNADIATTLLCGPTLPAGPGGPAEFQRHVVDVAAFPDALCNDGTPATLFFRPYIGAPNRNKWMINLHGGGACQNAETCAARWCNCDPNVNVCPYTTKPTNFNRTTMTNVGPPQKAADGLALRDDPLRPNPYGDYNQIELAYCTSDQWIGTRRAVPMTTVNPRTNAPVTYTINFLGARVLDAHIATLRQAGVAGLSYTIGGGAVAMPDLDEATEVIFTGDSAGGSGVMSNLDYLRTTLEATNANCQGGGACPLAVYGLLDASVGPEIGKLDFGTYIQPAVRSYQDYLAGLSALAYSRGSRIDASCEVFHAADPLICNETTHVVRHHITTPFFVRMALFDALNSDSYYIGPMLRNPDLTPITLATYSRTLHDELATFANLSGTAEEGSQFTREPGVFAPACTKHDTIHNTIQTFGTTITPPGGIPRRLIGVFDNWRTGSGTPTNLLTESPTRADTICP